MPVISGPDQYNAEDVFVDLEPVFGRRLYLKCEGFNFAGSIKLKAATEMVNNAERLGVLAPGSVLVESSSGNLGIALSMIAANRGYDFTCVTDSRCSRPARRIMEAFGARVHVITNPDPQTGLLGSRLNYVRSLCAGSDRYVWLNQYANPGNWQAHYRRTGPAIARQFPDLDVLFVGAGTTGTLMGCARYFRETAPHVTVVAVDAAGSVAFGGRSEPRMIPGLGTTVRPPLLDEHYVDGVVTVTEPDTIRACRKLAARGYLLGGSTGTVVAGAQGWLAAYRPGRRPCAVALAPDMGERYLETVYCESWVSEHYGLILPEWPADITGRLTHATINSMEKAG
jgi:N-(2-amino-2-carboxyethyl)-L-glutamate synthase